MVGLKTQLPVRTSMEGIPVEVRRSKRRRTRIGLAFDPAGYVIVEAPLDASSSEIRSLIREHRRWLWHRLEKVTDNGGLSACLSYASGELIHYLGHPYELVVRYGRRSDVQLKERMPAPGRQLGLFSDCHLGGRICVTVPALQVAQTHSGADVLVRAALNDWYRSRGDERFAQALNAWRRRLPWLHGVTPPWRHRFMRSQWGSCSRQGRISLNTHLVKTPSRLISYVVLHELCHLKHYDHSRRFYGLMSRYMPDWQQRRSDLDRYLPVLLQD
jgi:predicted metal-dependent hydrolase